jgi:hypothetical protein
VFHQAAEEFDHLLGGRILRGAHGLCRLQLEAPGEDREAAE